MTKKVLKIIIWIHLIVFYSVITFANDMTLAKKINSCITITILVIMAEKILNFAAEKESQGVMIFIKAFPYMLGNFGLALLIEKILEIMFNLFGFH